MRWHGGGSGATSLDRRIARVIAHRATPALERPSHILSWCADEHLVIPIAAGIWLLSRSGNARQRREADHLISGVAVAAVLPHLIKHLGAQILLGFQFQAPFQDAFFYLPPTAKAIELLVLCLTNTIGGCTGASSPGSARTKRLGQLFAARDGERNRWRMGDKKLARFADAKRLLFPDRGLRIPNGWNAAPDEQFLKGADKFREATNSLASL